MKLYIYGYLNAVPSSRRLEREAGRNVELMWLTERLAPDHKTIADFRKDHGAAIQQERAAEPGRQLIFNARHDKACRLLMSIPGVGAVTATSFVTAIEDPANFKKSRSVGAWLGLTTRRYQSGEVDYDGHISRRGDAHLRGLLYEAATVIMTRTHAESDLRTWGLRLREKIGFKRAAVAVARKLAVIMHAMLKSDELFDRTTAIA